MLVTTVFTFFVITFSVELSKNGQNTIGDIIGYLSLISEVRSRLLLESDHVAANHRKLQAEEGEGTQPLAGLPQQHRRRYEASILLPQCRNYVRQDQPMQFKACGFIQVFLDLTVIVQIIYYARKNKGRADEVEVEVQSNKD